LVCLTSLHTCPHLEQILIFELCEEIKTKKKEKLLGKKSCHLLPIKRKNNEHSPGTLMIVHQVVGSVRPSLYVWFFSSPQFSNSPLLQLFSSSAPQFLSSLEDQRRSTSDAGGAAASISPVCLFADSFCSFCFDFADFLLGLAHVKKCRDGDPKRIISSTV